MIRVEGLCPEVMRRSLDKDCVPERLRCAVCGLLCINPVSLGCCYSTVCDTDQCLTPCSSWGQCPVCEDSPFTPDLISPDRSLRNIVKLWCKNQWTKLRRSKEDLPTSAASCRNSCRASVVDLSFLTSSSRLLRLPQELLDVIFNLAYPCEMGARQVEVPQYQFSEQHLSDQAPVNRPRTKVMALTVSKQFFFNAASAWLKNNVLVDGKVALSAVYYTWGEDYAVAYDFAPGLSLKEFPLETFFCGILQQMLRGITIKVTPSTVGYLRPWAFVDLPRLEKFALARGLSHLSTIAKIQLDPDFDYELSSKDQEEWTIMVKQLESLLDDPRYALAEMLEKLSIANEHPALQKFEIPQGLKSMWVQRLSTRETKEGDEGSRSRHGYIEGTGKRNTRP